MCQPWSEYGILIEVPLSSIKKGPYRHQPFGPAYRPFFERMCRVFGEVMPDTPEAWEDDFRRDLNPEREMAIWRDLAEFYEHFTEGQNWSLERKKDLFSLLLACLSAGPRFALKQKLSALSRRKAKEIVEFVTRATGGKIRPPVVGPCRS